MASSGTYLNLTLPDVGSTLGPTWATTLNDAFIDLDDHDHSSQGKSVPSAGLNINADVEFNDYKITEIKTVSFQDQGTASGLSNKDLYVLSDDLYFRNSGTAVQLTDGTIAVGGMGLLNAGLFSGSTTINLSSTNAGVVLRSGTAGTINLPVDSTLGSQFFIIKDTAHSAGTITVNSGTGNYIYNDSTGSSTGTSITVSASGQVWLVRYGTVWYNLLG